MSKRPRVTLMDFFGNKRSRDDVSNSSEEPNGVGSGLTVDSSKTLHDPDSEMNSKEQS